MCRGENLHRCDQCSFVKRCLLFQFRFAAFLQKSQMLSLKRDDGCVLAGVLTDKILLCTSDACKRRWMRQDCLLSFTRALFLTRLN